QSLRELKAIELIHEKSLFPELAYMFKHALTQDVAYRSLLERRRRELHGLVGEAIEILYAERLAEQYDVLAHHFSKGEDWSKALHYFRLAAEKAGKALATREALALYDQALEAAGHLGDAVDPRTLIAIREDRANLFGIVRDFRRAQEEAEAWLELARRIGDREGEGTAQVTIGVMSVQAHDFARALDRAQRAIGIAEQIRSDRLLAQGHHVIGYVSALSGAVDAADDHLDRSLELGAAGGERLFRAQTLMMKGFVRVWQGDFAASRRLNRAALAASPQNSQMLTLLLGRWLDGLALIGLGRYDQALSTLREDLEVATKVGAEIVVHRITNTFGWLHMECGDARLAYQHNARCLELAGPRGDPETVANARLNLADILLLQDDRSPARQLLEEVHRVVRDPSTSEWMRWRYSTHLFGSLAALALAEGDPARAEEFANRCLDLATRSRAKKYLAIGWRLRGEIAAAGRRWEEAEAHLRSALAFARSLRNPTQLWKTQLSLGQLLAETGRRAAAGRAFDASRGVIDRLAAGLRTPTLKAGIEGSLVFRPAYERGAPGT
ncbi:MAG TPA: hypothetical protein VFG47_08655, partial [Geminicoccaceae bacterium]|nr:hypothetical protein [Geminicoccaceae bacterium]